jgi:hypothetical protein
VRKTLDVVLRLKMAVTVVLVVRVRVQVEAVDKGHLSAGDHPAKSESVPGVAVKVTD